MSPQMGLWATLTNGGWADNFDEERMVYNSRVARLRKNEYPMLKGTLPLNDY
jgi:hypothetical protein